MCREKDTCIGGNLIERDVVAGSDIIQEDLVSVSDRQECSSVWGDGRYDG